MDKACPVIVRERSGVELLMFNHPIAGCQLVKGTIEKRETLGQACERELFEESGVLARATTCLGMWQSSIRQEEVWGFCVMEPKATLPEKWTHYTEDDGGLLFQFFWHPIDNAAGPDWHKQYVEAVDFIRSVL